ncbi:hypothetical protein QTN25_006311 [Entamoeba marina]
MFGKANEFQKTPRCHSVRTDSSKHKKNKRIVKSSCGPDSNSSSCLSLEELLKQNKFELFSSSNTSFEELLAHSKSEPMSTSSGTSFDCVQEQFIQISPVYEEYNNPQNDKITSTEGISLTTSTTVSNVHKPISIGYNTFRPKVQRKLEYEEAKNNYKTTKVELKISQKLEKLFKKNPDANRSLDQSQMQNQTTYFKRKCDDDKALLHQKRKERIKQFYHRTH